MLKLQIVKLVGLSRGAGAFGCNRAIMAVACMTNERVKINSRFRVLRCIGVFSLRTMTTTKASTLNLLITNSIPNLTHDYHTTQTHKPRDFVYDYEYNCDTVVGTYCIIY